MSATDYWAIRDVDGLPQVVSEWRFECRAHRVQAAFKRADVRAFACEPIVDVGQPKPTVRGRTYFSQVKISLFGIDEERIGTLGEVGGI